jgi:hypothetical protein
MQESKCPECGVPVGGSHHRLMAGNRAANNFLRDAGALDQIQPADFRVRAEQNLFIPPELH